MNSFEDKAREWISDLDRQIKAIEEEQSELQHKQFEESQPTESTRRKIAAVAAALMMMQSVRCEMKRLVKK